MSNSLVISAKILGAFALPDACPRCLWIKLKLKNNLPYQIFPGIFSSIDSYTKKVVHGYFDKNNHAPDWLLELGNIKTYINPPHFTKFGVTDENTSILLRGNPDGIYVKEDGSYIIADYKTAKFTAHQDELFPMYDIQLNAYAFIGERNDFSPVTKLALIYTEPNTDDKSAEKSEHQTDKGFKMDFSAHILLVDIDETKVTNLLKDVLAMHELNDPPDRNSGCKDCRLLDNLVAITKL